MRYRLADHGLVFSTRDRGARVLTDVREKMGGTSTVAIDFADVKSVSYSFADEFIGRLMQDARASEITVTLVNMSPSAARTIERSLRRRGLSSDVVLETA